MPRKNNPLVSENVHIYRKNGASDDLAALGIPGFREMNWRLCNSR
ncbi:MAG: hypothetical protein ACK4VM_14185 [Bosea sp. (in: a-proteobacteria)]